MLRSFAARQPVLFSIGLTFVSLILLLFTSSIAYTQPDPSYADIAMTIMRMVITAALLLLAWRLDWLNDSGITRLGRWQVWLLAGSSLVYFTCAALYAFYGQVTFDISNIIRISAAREIVFSQVIVGIYEEILFRGVILYVLVSAWSHKRLGLIGSAVLTAVIFAIPHMFGVLWGISWQASLPLVLEVAIIAVWWGALVIWGGSIWPAFILHFVVNAVVALQGLSVPMITPDVLVYQRLLMFSIPLAVIGIGLLVKRTSKLMDEETR